MVELIYAPDPQQLLPPILACLPTSFASPRPPPAFIPLVSPILRQRLHLILSARTENWLHLLCWDDSKAERLKEQVENTTFEPHPVSGEIEVGDVNWTRYKRFDEETLRSQLSLADWPFTPVFLWCTGDDAGDGWKLAELLPSPEADASWSTSIEKANSSSKERIMAEALQEADASTANRPQLSRMSTQGRDEDDYWAQYDQTPAETPQPRNSTQPDQSDADYYARYSEVQPAMDNHEPDADLQGGEAVNGNGVSLQTSHSGQTARSIDPPSYQDPVGLVDGNEKPVEIQQPVPDSPSSDRGSDAVGRLESEAERFNASEIGIRQHISTSIKSMYRLAKSAGMDRETFERTVQREVETLSILDRDE